ncbi:hypothetical protein GCM10012275_63340 [Longimycelium tulufanense]|uniref:Uncharacterized protein n=1 Tax=Longimycelium tulufanense TaxID=907463 RepID=A0A8J3CEQ0_9PSEU|nr:DUF3558 domain-containing protein [Longimycelium tulufanense]GGM84045.1 hypothetical protein GCM10012275_63340 [Longimycelium tulufanense]
MHELKPGAAKITEARVGKHDGRQAEKTNRDGRCQVDLAIGDTSSASVGVEANATPKACDVARKVAETIEPKPP